MMDALKAHVAQMAKLFAIDEIKVDVTQMANSDTAEQNCHDPDSELHQATSHGNALIAKSLVSMTGAQSYINYTDGDGCTPHFKALFEISEIRISNHRWNTKNTSNK